MDNKSIVKLAIKLKGRADSIIRRKNKEPEGSESQADAALMLEATTLLMSIHDKATNGQNAWQYDLGPKKVPSEFVQVAFDEGMGHMSIKVCERIITRSMATYDRPLSPENYEYGWRDADGRMVHPDRAAYAWRRIEEPLSRYEAAKLMEARKNTQPDNPNEICSLCERPTDHGYCSLCERVMPAPETVR